MTEQAKIRVSVASLALLAEVHEYIDQFDIRGETLSHAASDVLDGLVTREEVDDLVRRRLLSVVPYDEPDEYDRERSALCGTTWTVSLTPRAMAALWPERMAAIGSS